MSVTTWLAQRDLHQYRDILIANEFSTMLAFRQLEESDLSTMGIHKVGARRMIMNAVKEARRAAVKERILLEKGQEGEVRLEDLPRSVNQAPPLPSLTADETGAPPPPLAVPRVTRRVARFGPEVDGEVKEVSLSAAAFKALEKRLTDQLEEDEEDSPGSSPRSPTPMARLPLPTVDAGFLDERQASARYGPLSPVSRHVQRFHDQKLMRRNQQSAMKDLKSANQQLLEVVKMFERREWSAVQPEELAPSFEAPQGLVERAKSVGIVLGRHSSGTPSSWGLPDTVSHTTGSSPPSSPPSTPEVGGPSIVITGQSSQQLHQLNIPRNTTAQRLMRRPSLILSMAANIGKVSTPEDAQTYADDVVKRRNYRKEQIWRDVKFRELAVPSTSPPPVTTSSAPSQSLNADGYPDIPVPPLGAAETPIPLLPLRKRRTRAHDIVVPEAQMDSQGIKDLTAEQEGKMLRERVVGGDTVLTVALQDKPSSPVAAAHHMMYKLQASMRQTDNVIKIVANENNTLEAVLTDFVSLMKHNKPVEGETAPDDGSSLFPRGSKGGVDPKIGKRTDAEMAQPILREFAESVAEQHSMRRSAVGERTGASVLLEAMPYRVPSEDPLRKARPMSAVGPLSRPLDEGPPRQRRLQSSMVARTLPYTYMKCREREERRRAASPTPA